MAGEELEEIQLPGFEHEQQTIFCGNVGNNLIIQATPNGIYLINPSESRLVTTWKPTSGTITVCTCNSVQIAVAAGGNQLIILEVEGNALRQVA